MCVNLTLNISHKGTKITKENKKKFLIFKPLNHKNTEGNIGIYKLSPKLPSVLSRGLCVLCVSVRVIFGYIYFLC